MLWVQEAQFSTDLLKAATETCQPRAASAGQRAAKYEKCKLSMISSHIEEPEKPRSHSYSRWAPPTPPPSNPHPSSSLSSSDEMFEHPPLDPPPQTHDHKCLFSAKEINDACVYNKSFNGCFDIRRTVISFPLW